MLQQPAGDAAIEAEKRQFRQLAKKLKIKGSRVSRDDDGLDGFTAGLTTAGMEFDNSGAPSSSATICPCLNLLLELRGVGTPCLPGAASISYSWRWHA